MFSCSFLPVCIFIFLSIYMFLSAGLYSTCLSIRELKLTHFYCPVLKDIRRLCQKMSDTSVARFNDQKINLSYVRGNPRENSNGYASFIRFNICWGLCFAISMCFIVAFLLLAHSELEWDFCAGFSWGVKYYSHIWFWYTTGLLRYQRPQKDKKGQNFF